MANEGEAGRPGPEVIDFLVRQGILSGDHTAVFTPLTGGVASDIWRVDQAGRTVVVKKALEKLRVARDWRAPVSRNASEVEWLTVAGEIVPESVPAILAHDESVGAFVMSYLDPLRHPVWKHELLAGRADPRFAAKVGDRLGRIHQATAGRADLAFRFDNDAVFHAIRLEPYLEATAERHPDLAEALHRVSRETLAFKRSLVHGDVSPKNILVGPEDPVFLDAECAWYGDPAFDIAFCLNHLLLKGLVVPGAREDLAASFGTLVEAYFGAASFEPRPMLEGRAARLLPALLLARVDGKSPVEYVTEDDDRDRVRCVARPLIGAAPATLGAVLMAWNEDLGR